MKDRLTIDLLNTASSLAFFKLTFIPDLNLLTWVFIAMLLDLITGVIKAMVQQQARTSAGYRKTVVKFTQYVGAIAVGIVLANALPKENAIVGYVNSGLLVLLIYIETTSVFENLYAIDSSSSFSRFFIAPILKILTFAMSRMPLNKAAEEK